MKLNSSLLLIIILLFSLFLSARDNNAIPHVFDSTSVLIDSVYLSPVRQSIQKYISRLEESGTIKLDKQKIADNASITGLYEVINYKPLWDSVNRADLIDVLEDAYFEGLNPKDYHIDFIKSYDALIQNREKISADDSAAADIIMTNALLTYAYHLIEGKLHPKQLDPDWNYSNTPLPDSAEFRVLHRLKTHSLKPGIDNIRPELPIYHEFRFWFARYDSIQKADGEIAQIEYPGSPLRFGDSSDVVGELKRHIDNYAYAFNAVDNDIFDEELKATLINFQSHHGLDPDGIAGKKTFEALNMSIEERMDIIRVNMERCRWLNNELPQEFLLVNIVDFHLYIFRNRQIDYHSRVVVGKEQNKTPVFTSEIKYVVFNPTWTVPYSIASKEILPKLKHDPNYLQNRNMTLLRGGKEVNPSTIDFSQYSERKFPFTIRQEPGPNNALGLVKFIFPNKHAVYLHDTPSKSYFEKSERAFSHGCVRVKNPLILAEQLLGDQGYDQTKIANVIKTKKIQNVYLKKPMTVMLMYWTCYENREEGKMYFYRDIYDRDELVIKELKRGR